MVHEIQFREMFDQASDLIHFATPEGTVLYVNKAWTSTLGYEKEEIVRRNIYSVVAPENRAAFEAVRNYVITNKIQGQFIETVFISKDGRPIVVEGFIGCQYDGSNVLYTHVIFRDITKRKAEEQRFQQLYDQLQEREENFQNLIKYAPDGIIVINEFSEILLWNPKCEDIFGWTADEVCGLPLGQTIIPEQHRKAHYEGLKRYLSSGELRVLNKTIEITALNKKGEEFFIALTISRALQQGKTVFIAFIRNIHHEKKMQQQLLEQKQKLEQKNEELGQYASLASHDLKEPIRKMLIFSDRIMNLPQDQLGAVTRESITKIHSAAQRMSELITGISRYSNISIQSGTVEALDLYSVIEDVKWDLELIIREKNATITIEDLPQINAIRFHMHQLFQNLITNSIKYSKPDVAPFITITGKKREDGYVEIVFKDNGIGFDNKYALKVFQAFQRLHGTAYEGMGIGLTICKKIVELYGGTIHVESEPGMGATFIFTLRT